MNIMESYDPDTTPAGIPPPGVTPNLIDPVSLQSATIGIFVTLMALATLAVIARIFGSIGGLGIHDGEFFDALSLRSNCK